MSQKITKFKKRTNKQSKNKHAQQLILSEQNIEKTNLPNVLYARDYDLSDYLLASLHEKSQDKDCYRLTEFKIYESRVNEQIQNSIQAKFSEFTPNQISKGNYGKRLGKSIKKTKSVVKSTKDLQFTSIVQNSDIVKQRELEIEIQFNTFSDKWRRLKDLKEEKDEITTETSARSHLKPVIPKFKLGKLKKIHKNDL